MTIKICLWKPEQGLLVIHPDYSFTSLVFQKKKCLQFLLDKIASVSFSAFLVDVAAAKRIWRGKYTKTQQSLSDNLLKAPEFFKQGGKWLSAIDLARYGIKKVLVSFPL